MYGTAACTVHLTTTDNLQYPMAENKLVHLSIQQSVAILH